jgi:hypothetical protein
MPRIPLGSPPAAGAVLAGVVQLIVKVCDWPEVATGIPPSACWPRADDVDAQITRLVATVLITKPW